MVAVGTRFPEENVAAGLPLEGGGSCGIAGTDAIELLANSAIRGGTCAVSTSDPAEVGQDTARPVLLPLGAMLGETSDVSLVELTGGAGSAVTVSLPGFAG